MPLINKIKKRKSQENRFQENSITSSEKRLILGYSLTSLDFTAMLVPVIVIIWQKLGLTFGEMLLLQGIFTTSVLIAEVPSGALSDSWLGRKWTEVIANSIHALSMLIFAFANDFNWLAISEIIAGISLAMKSGNSSALLYDSLIENKKESMYSSIVCRTMTLSFISASISTIVGGLLGEINLRFPLILLALIYSVVTVYLIIVVKEPDRVRAKSAIHATKQATRSILTKPVLSLLVIYSVAPAALSTIVFWSYQPLMIELGAFGAFEIGMAMASFNIVAAIGSRLINQVKAIKDSVWLLSMMMIVGTIGTIWIMIANSIVTLLLSIYILQLIRGITRVYYLVVQQNYLESSERSTFNSIDSLKNSLIYAVLASSMNGFSVRVVIGIAITGYFIVTIIVIIMTLVFYNFPSKKKARKGQVVALT